MNQMGIAVVFALSFNMLLGQGGMLSFGHAVYFGLGGFIAAHVLNLAGRGTLWIPVPVLPLVGGLGGLAFAILFGSFSTRRAGTVFAMISLGVAELMAASSLIFDRFFGGEEGITTNRSKAPLLLGLEFTRDRQVYYLIAFWLFVSAIAMYAFSRTPVGRMANAVRDNPERAEFVGYSQNRVRFVSFCAAGFFAGIAGGLFAVNYEILTAENMGLNASGAVLLMTYIGGIGYFVGPIIGAVVFTFLQSMLSDYTGMWLLYLGILFLATVLFVPMGLAGVLMLHAPAWRARRIGRLFGPYVLTGALGLLAAVGVIGLLELVDVRKSLGATPIIRGVSLTLEAGTRQALIGPNGAGKSTLFNLITGKYEVTTGRIRVKGADVTDLAPYEINRRGLSRSFQVTNIFTRMSVFENLRF